MDILDQMPDLLPEPEETGEFHDLAELDERIVAEPGLPEPVPVPEEAVLADQYQDPPLPDFVPPPLPLKRGPRAEWIMGVIAILSAALLLTMVVLCIPYFNAPDPEDPETVLHQQETQILESVEETYLEPTESETEPENPTIPPAPNPYDRNDFQYNSRNYLLLQNQESWPGVDVSAFQKIINWKKVAQSGIEFAMIRLGYRGYETGKLVEDEYARQNLKGAKAAGLKTGAYFFSQALNTKEAQEEIDYMLKILGSHELDMPIVLDWEIPTATSRTANMDARTLTDIQHYFCEKMMELGYTPMVYFNWHQSENLYYLAELEHAPFWLALYQDRMTYPWAVDMWQYTDRGSVPGIPGNVDMNVYFPS